MNDEFRVTNGIAPLTGGIAASQSLLFGYSAFVITSSFVIIICYSIYD
jgi:hypothetical protein